MDDFEDKQPGGLDEILRAVARHVSDSVDRVIAHTDVEEVAEFLGVEPDRAREWAQEAGEWLRTQAEGAAAKAAEQADAAARAGRDELAEIDRRESKRRGGSGADPLQGAAPHPLDLPTPDQGTALAALDSGRWTVEAGSGALTSSGEGPGPSDALGLARELRARDWLSAEGRITVAGRHALSRWLEQ